MRHGFLLIDKPEGPTSHDVVAIVRRALNEKSIGHLGTLDPAASGLLVLAVGKKALKVVELFKDLPKEYEAEITLGAVSTTYDREGIIEKVERKIGVPEPDEKTIQNLIADYFVGKVEQVPPAYSAVSIGGERAYRKMRQGQTVDMPSRTVEISSCNVTSFSYPLLTLSVACGSGTYIRSLAHDLGQKVRDGGYLSGLRRTSVGEWSVDDACAPGDARWTDVVPLKEVMQSFEKIEITKEEMEDVCHGRSIERTVKPNTIAWHEDLPVAILMPSKEDSGTCGPRKVFA